MERIVVYKFPQLTAEVLKAMFGLKEWEQT